MARSDDGADDARKPVRIGVIGLGVMGHNHLRVLSELKSAQVVGVAEQDRGVCDELAAQYGTRAFSDHRGLIEQALDAVVVAVPTSLHHTIGCECIERGIHVLIEKPIATGLDEAAELVALARTKNVGLMVGHIERFNPAAQTLKTALGAEQIISISITRVGPFPPRINDVGIVIDLAVHDIDLIRWLTGSEICAIQPLLSRTLSQHEDSAFLQFRTDSGVLAHINTNWLTPYKERRIVVATRERLLYCDLWARTVTEFSDYRIDGSFMTRNLGVGVTEPLRAELQAFVEAVRNNQPPPITGEDGMKSLQIALDCLRAP